LLQVYPITHGEEFGVDPHTNQKGKTMKLLQENNGFSPIAVVLETMDEAIVFCDILNRVKKTTKKDAEYEMAKTILIWIINEAKF
jgi:hypothetical protein